MGQRVSVTGFILIVLGLLFLLVQRMGIGGEGVVAIIGLAFLVAYATTRHYAFLVPGGIMTGLGIGIIYETRLHASGAPVLLGLGLGFLGIYVIGSLRGRTAGDRWPIIPGGILTAAALLIAANQTGILGAVGRWWPLVLIAVGVYVILRPRQGRTS